MKIKPFTALLVAIVLLYGAFLHVRYITPKAKVHRSLHRIESIDQGDNKALCSAFSVGRHVIATAEHCLLREDAIRIDGRDVRILNIIKDGQDHVLIFVPEITFVDYVSHWSRPYTGEAVYMWGNPYSIGIFDMYREGYMSGPTHTHNKFIDAFRLPVFEGDSGSLIFNKYGQIVAILNASDNGFAGSYPYAFSTADLWYAENF